jgi:transcriptional regulator with XRE-family HTH domain
VGKGEPQERIRKAVAANIRSARRKAGLTQHELASRIGGTVTGQQVSRWERNETSPGYANIEAIALALGLTDAWFFTERDGSR